MNRGEWLLSKVAEEAGELIERAAKCQQYGINEIQEGQELTNGKRMQQEFMDVLSMMSMLVEEGFLLDDFDNDHLDKKRIKVEKYYQYAKECGIITE